MRHPVAVGRKKSRSKIEETIPIFPLDIEGGGHSYTHDSHDLSDDPPPTALVREQLLLIQSQTCLKTFWRLLAYRAEAIPSSLHLALLGTKYVADMRFEVPEFPYATAHPGAFREPQVSRTILQRASRTQEGHKSFDIGGSGNLLQRLHARGVRTYCNVKFQTRVVKSASCIFKELGSA